MNHIPTLEHDRISAYQVIEAALYKALISYGNVHRGSSFASMATTQLYEKAKEVVLQHLGLSKQSHLVVFASPRRADAIAAHIDAAHMQRLSGSETGLKFGVVALAIRYDALPKNVPFIAGGGTTQLYGDDWVISANGAERLEAGTPAIINCIAFAVGLQLMEKYGIDAFLHDEASDMTVEEIFNTYGLEQLKGMELLTGLRKTLVGRGLKVPTLYGNKTYVNLDNAASTPTFEAIWETFRKAYRQQGQTKEAIIQHTRLLCSKFFNAPPDEYDIVFTSNATEAINLAAESLSLEPVEPTQPVIVSSLLEHSSNDLSWRMVKGHELIRISIDAEGFFNLEELEKLLADYNEAQAKGNRRVKLLAVSGASNVTGSCNNLRLIGAMTRRYGVRLLVDGAQLGAHKPVDMFGLGIDYLAVSAHKMYAPFGCGVLLVRKGLLHFSPAEMDAIKSSGEANTGGIAALGQAMLLIERIGFDVIEREEQKLLSQAIHGMAHIRGLRFIGLSGVGSQSLADKTGVIGFEIKNKMNSSVSGELARTAGIGVRYGCLCAHLTIKHLLEFKPWQDRLQRTVKKMIPAINLQGVTRISFGLQNNTQDVEALLNALGTIANSTARKKASDPSKHSHAEVKRQIMTMVEEIIFEVFGT